MNKFFKSTKFLVALVLVIMILTTASSFAYWRFGLSGSDKGDSIQIQIGEGRSVETSVSLTPSITGVTGMLIPQNKVPQAGEITEVSFSYSVVWNWTGADPSYNNENGTLTSTCTSIKVNGEEFKGVAGLSGQPLFVVTVTPSTATVKKGIAQTITVTVKMNEPANKAQYDLIANGTLELFFSFVVETRFD